MDARLRRWNGWALAALAFTGSLLLALGSPPNGWSWLVWLGFVPLTLVARVAPRRPTMRLFAFGWVGGLCVGLVGFPWIAELLERFAEFPWPLAAFGLLVFSAWTAVPYGVWLLGTRLGPQRGLASILWPAILWVALAAVWPGLFPYTAVIGLALTPAWMQGAEIAGVAMCELQVVIAGVLIADGLLAKGRARWTRIAAGFLIPVLSFALGSWRISTLKAELEEVPTVRFGIVQPNSPLGSRDVHEKMRRLREQSRAAEKEGAQIIVWPEAGAFPFMGMRPVERDFTHPSKQVLSHHKVPTIFGLPTRDRRQPYEYNSVLALDAEGRAVGQFDKVILVPFGEYVPVVDPKWALSIVPAMSHNLAGEGPARFVLQPKRNDELSSPEHVVLGPLICYEDIFPGFAREVAVQEGGIDAFVNVTIDTWFGDTAGPWEHLALAQFRSVEHRVPLIRSVAAGPSAYVDITGALAAVLPVQDPWPDLSIPAQRLVVDVPLPRNTETDPTVYARVGWLLPWVCVVLVVVLPLLRVMRSRKASSSQ